MSKNMAISIGPKTPILTDEVLAVLYHHGHRSVVTNGHWAIPIASYDPHRAPGDLSLINIPELFNSIETLRFFSLDGPTSESIWFQYCTHINETQSDLVGGGGVNVWHAARAYVHGFPEDAVAEEDDWKGVMKRMGMTEGFRENISSEQAKGMRSGGGGLRRLVLCMLDLQWQFLRGLSAAILSRMEGVGVEIGPDGKPVRDKDGVEGKGKGKVEGKVDEPKALKVDDWDVPLADVGMGFEAWYSQLQ